MEGGAAERGRREEGRRAHLDAFAEATGARTVAAMQDIVVIVGSRAWDARVVVRVRRLLQIGHVGRGTRWQKKSAPDWPRAATPESAVCNAPNRPNCRG